MIIHTKVFDWSEWKCSLDFLVDRASCRRRRERRERQAKPGNHSHSRESAFGTKPNWTNERTTKPNLNRQLSCWFGRRKTISLHIVVLDQFQQTFASFSSMFSVLWAGWCERSVCVFTHPSIHHYRPHTSTHSPSGGTYQRKGMPSPIQRVDWLQSFLVSGP